MAFACARFPGLVLGCWILLLWPTSGARALPLPPAAQRIIEQPPDEPPYKVRLHFLTSNERRHDLFFPVLRGRGGGYVGVAADQNYTLAAVAGAELVWLIDIDEQVVQWHRIYAALLPRCDTPAGLAALLGPARDAEARAALIDRWGEAPSAPLLIAYRRDRWRIAAHVRREMTGRQAGQPVTWLADPALFAAVRRLAQERRIIARVGDLNGERTLPAIAEAARQARVPIRTVYLSNAEQWFRYTPQFARNLALVEQTGDGRAVVLRTLARGEVPWPAGDRWHFSVQLLPEFVRRLQDGLQRIHQLMPEMVHGDRAVHGLRGLSLLGALARRSEPPGAAPGPVPPLRAPGAPGRITLLTK